MAAHTSYNNAPDSPAGVALLPVFTVALILGVVAIGVLLAFPSAVTVVIAMAVVIGLAVAVTALLARIIGPSDH